jgi:Ser/Thr protein kinase RdoA (MazF antagonist)
MLSSGAAQPGPLSPPLALLEGGAPSLASIAGAFELPSPASSLAPLGNGNVNDTYLLRCADGERFVLQRLNTAVFSRPDQVMENLALLCDHAGPRDWPQTDQPRRWDLPRLVPTRLSEAGCSSRPWLERHGECWRLLTYVPDTICHDTVTSPELAGEVGRALGGFHRLIHDLPCDRLHDTLPGFHVTPAYLAAYDALLLKRVLPLNAEERQCRDAIEARRSLAPVLEEALASGRLSQRPIHGDPKVNNVLLDRGTGRAVALIDLDTVKPGLLQYDIGDCLRSGCNPAGEETTDLEAVRFDLELARPMLAGYLELARPILTDADLDLMVEAVRLISFELGLRFFSDHLAGNRYFKCRHPRHNLERARVQFRLTESIEAQLHDLHQLVEQLR